jgi:hypothetical protein
VTGRLLLLACRKMLVMPRLKAASHHLPTSDKYISVNIKIQVCSLSPRKCKTMYELIRIATQ